MGIRLRITNRIELLSDAMLDVETVRPLLALFEHDNPQHHKLKRMGFSTKGEPPVYRLWQKTFNPRDDDRVYSFPRGGLALITAWLDEHPTLEWEGVIVDETTLGDADLTGAIPEHRVELRPYQRTSVDKLIAAGSGILRAPTAAGKTCIAFALASELNLPTVIVCPNGAIFDLWIKRAETELGLKGDALGIIRASVCRIRPLTIAMQKTIAVQGSQAWRSAFGVVIIDECFAGETAVLMEDGTKKHIAEIEVGDTVALGGKVVATRAMDYGGEVFVMDGTRVTANHPYATQRGWVAVKSLVRGDDVYYDPSHDLRSLRREASEDQPAGNLPPTRLLQDVRPGDGAVQSVRALGANGLARGSRDRRMCAGDRGVERGLDDEGGRAARLEVSRNQTPGADCFVQEALAGPEVSRKVFQVDVKGPARTVLSSGGDSCFQGDCAEVARREEDKGFRGPFARQRDAGDCIRGGDVSPVEGGRVRARSRGDDGLEEAGAATPLQVGPGERLEEDCAGAGREQSSPPLAEGERCPEGQVAEIERLAGTTLPGAVRLQRDGASLPVSLGVKKLRVFNFQTENGVYVAGGILVHNCQFAAARTYVEAIDPFTARHRFGISADERRKDGREFLTHDLFGPVVHDIDREVLVEAGHIMDVEIMVIPTEFRADWYSSDAAGEKRWNGKEMVTMPAGGAGGFGRLLEELSADEERSQLAVDAAALEILEGGQMFVMATRREHCRMLDAMLAARGFKSGLMMGGPADRAEFLKSHAALSDGSYDAAIGTVQAIGTGVDMPNIAGVVVAAPIGNNRQLFNQVRGRAARRATDGKAKRLYYLWDRNVFPTHLKNLVKWNPTVRVKLGADWLEPKEYFRRRPLPGTPKAALLARRA